MCSSLEEIFLIYGGVDVRASDQDILAAKHDVIPFDHSIRADMFQLGGIAPLATGVGAGRSQSVQSAPGEPLRNCCRSRRVSS
jgi:hypothetical protein